MPASQMAVIAVEAVVQEQVCQGTWALQQRPGLQAGCPGAGLGASTGPSREAIGTGQGVTWTQNFRRREPLRVSHEEWP